MPTLDPTSDLDIQIPTGEEIYNAIMGEIEPELLSQNIPSLDEKYSGETEEERAKRLKRYQEAYKTYDEKYTKWIEGLKQLVEKARRHAIQSAEKESRDKELVGLAYLESQLSQI